MDKETIITKKFNDMIKNNPALCYGLIKETLSYKERINALSVKCNIGLGFSDICTIQKCGFRFSIFADLHNNTPVISIYLREVI